LDKSAEYKLILGQNWQQLDEVDSTNAWAKRKLVQGTVLNGYVFQAKFQSEGRGQQQKEWKSEKGQNALFSLVKNVSGIDLRHLASLNFAVSLACLEALQDYLPSAHLKIKWPNDIYHHNKKLAGILIENMIGGDHRYSIIGVGVNVNQDHFSKDLHHAVSLKTLNSMIMKVDEVVEDLVRRINIRVDDLIQRNNLQRLREEYVSNLYKLHENLKFELEDEIHLATLIGVDPLGRVVFVSEGKTLAFAHGEVKITWR